VLNYIEVIEDPNEPGTWIVEAQTEDGGIRRAFFVDADAESRAIAYAEIMRSQRQLHQRRFAAVNG
jgi:hypothetical protein